MLAKPFTYQQPYKGRWDLSCNSENVGVVKGDAVVGFIAQDHLDRTLGSYQTSKEAMDAVVFVAEARVFAASWLMSHFHHSSPPEPSHDRPRKPSEPKAVKPYA